MNEQRLVDIDPKSATSEEEILIIDTVNKFLEKSLEKAPDVIGLSVYYWNMAQNQYVVRRIREMYGDKVIVDFKKEVYLKLKIELNKFIN